MTALVIVAGTFVTATGPHGGDENVARLGEPVSECREDPRVHSCGTISRIDHVEAESP